MATIETITAFHTLRNNFSWPKDAATQGAALAKALDYQRAFYPVREELTEAEQTVFDDAIALLALEMIGPTTIRAAQQVKKLKEASSSGASIETEYEESPADPFPQVRALLAPLDPSGTSESPAVSFGRLVR